MSKAWEAQSHVANTVHGDISNSIVIQGQNIHMAHLATHEVSWPVRVGTIPEQAAHYQNRAIAAHLNTALNSFGTVVLRQVLSGTGGVGKTQLAAHHARALARITTSEKRVEVLVWAHASSREQITYAYAQAARQLYSTIPNDLENAAQLFLAWLQDPSKHQNRRWLIVWDDLTDPAQVQDLWPPCDQPHGRVLATTRRRDHALTTQGCHLLDIGIYTPGEARAFLASTLDAAGIAHTTAQIDTLSHNLGHLPLALGQAVTYMTELAMGCDDYLQVFHDRMSTLDQVFPDWENPTPLAATWALSLAQADAFNPKGMARPLMGLIALLDGTGVPEQVLTCPPVLKYLSAHRAEPITRRSAMGTATDGLTSHQPLAALANLRRLNLVTGTSSTSHGGDKAASNNALVSTHHLIQRATREHASTRPTRNSVRALAEALVQAWPKIEHNAALGQQLRSNTTALRSHHTVEGRSSEDWLWESDEYTVLFRAGQSLGEAGQASEAVAHWQHVAETAHQRLGPDHPHTLTARNNLASWRGHAGDAAAAAHAFQDLLTDQLRILGPNHPDTLTARSNLAHWHGEAGDPNAAATSYQDLLTDQLRILGPDHPDTLTTHSNLASWRGHAGNAAAAAHAFQDLLTIRTRFLGPDHPHTLTTRNNLAHWHGEAGDPNAAATSYQDLLTDQLRVLGPDHPHTLTARANLAVWTYRSGDAVKAVELLTTLIDDRRRVLGSDHPDTQSSEQVLRRWQGELPNG
ncbi:tetratricopeptide repeat protein [Nocardiopsis dassonvillei]